METTTVMLLISAGEKALFSCATDANIPGLTATWLKDNKPVGDALADRVKVNSTLSKKRRQCHDKILFEIGMDAGLNFPSKWKSNLPD